MKIRKVAIPLCFVFAFANVVYAQSEDCEVAMSEAESYASDLEITAKKLRRCASNEEAPDLEYRAKKLQSCAGWADYTDDCYSEFRKVKREYSNTEACDREYRKTKSIFSYYESAVSDASNYCE